MSSFTITKKTNECSNLSGALSDYKSYFVRVATSEDNNSSMNCAKLLRPLYAVALLSVVILMKSSLAYAQSCQLDVVFLFDNSNSINLSEFDAMQEAVSEYANAEMGNRIDEMVVYGWAAPATKPERTGVGLIDAQSSGLEWSSQVSDFQYSGLNNSANQVCRRFSKDDDTDGCGGFVTGDPADTGFDYHQQVINEVRFGLTGNALMPRGNLFPIPNPVDQAERTTTEEPLVVVKITDGEIINSGFDDGVIGAIWADNDLSLDITSYGASDGLLEDGIPIGVVHLPDVANDNFVIRTENAWNRYACGDDGVDACNRSQSVQMYDSSAISAALSDVTSALCDEFPAVLPESVPVPALSVWGLVLLSLAMLILGIWIQQKRSIKPANLL